MWVRVAAVGSFEIAIPIVIMASFHSIAVYLLEDGHHYAIENTCTHQNLPLAGGDCVDGIVECPFHFARFSIKTGEVCSPPAFGPVQTYKTRIENGYVEVLVS